MLNAVIGYQAIQPSLYLPAGIFSMKMLYRNNVSYVPGDKGKGKVVVLLK
jgi:hypothetical protein